MIVHCGEALIDFIPRRSSDGSTVFAPVPGGSPFNSAIASARLGAAAAFFGKISDDFFGDLLVEALAHNGVDMGFVTRESRPSTLAFVKKNEQGEARYAFFANDAADRSLGEHELPVLPSDVHAIHVGSISLLGEPVGATLEKFARGEAGKRVVSFDPNVRPTLIADPVAYRQRIRAIADAATIIKVSDEDLEWIAGDSDLPAAAEGLLGGKTELVVVTRGSDGIDAYGSFGAVTVPSVAVDVADTIGAGDSFHAAILSWLELSGRLSRDAISSLDRERVESMLTFAAGVASVTCSRAGADPPRMSELPERIRPI